MNENIAKNNDIDYFFQTIERAFCELPDIVKKAMVNTGFDSLGSVVDLTAEDLLAIKNSGPIVLAGHIRALEMMASTLKNIGLDTLKKIGNKSRAPVFATQNRGPKPSNKETTTGSVQQNVLETSLQTLISDWLRKYTGKAYDKNLIIVNITAGPPMSATVQCVDLDCPHVVAISAQPRKNSDTFRWVASNFYSHFKLHLSGTTQTKTVFKTKLYQPKIVSFTQQLRARDEPTYEKPIEEQITIGEREDPEDYEEIVVPHPFSSFDDVIETLADDVIETLADDELISKFIATGKQLKILIKTLSKNTHFLTESDIDGRDGMNYEAVKKISDIRVENCLIENVPGSEGTILYLKLIRNATAAFTEPKLEIEEKVHKIWYCVFILRGWKWISKQKQVTPDNFVTSNAYACIELNAHAIINLIMTLKDQPELCLPTLCNSQHCEQYFRFLRSMGSTLCTVVNFSLMDVLQRIKRIHVEAELNHDLRETFVMPEKVNSCEPPQKLPEASEIDKIVENARLLAVADLFKVGINSSCFDCQLSGNYKEDVSNEKSSDYIPGKKETIDEEIIDEEIIDDLTIIINNCPNGLDIPHVSVSDADSRHVKMTDHGQEIYVKKSTLCWLLSNKREKISSDRLRRFNDTSKVSSNKLITQCSINCEISIGDWCCFTNFRDLVIGQVIGFQYIKGVGKSKTFTYDTCPVQPPPDVKKPKGINVIGNWCLFNRTNDLQPCSKQFFINIENYSTHIEPPSLLEKRLCLTNKSFDYLQSFIDYGTDPLQNDDIVM